MNRRVRIKQMTPERSAMNICCSNNAFKATDFNRVLTSMVLCFLICWWSLVCFQDKLIKTTTTTNEKYHSLYTLKFQDSSSSIFADIQQKVQSQKCSVTYWQIAYYRYICNFQFKKKEYKTKDAMGRVYCHIYTNNDYVYKLEILQN